jgi:SulP family sulfate permease
MAAPASQSLGSAKPSFAELFTPNPHNGDVLVYRITGAFFFGATAAISTVLNRMGERPKVFILDFSAVPLVDSTAANALEGFVKRLAGGGTEVCFAGASAEVRRALMLAGLRAPHVRYVPTVDAALARRRGKGERGAGGGEV